MRMLASVVLGALAVVLLFGAAAAGGLTSSASGGRYEFMPARQHLWVVDQERGAILFFQFPDTETRPIQRSRIFMIDRERFPADQTRYLLSSREITSILWIVNEHSGEVQVVTYRKDGTFSTHFHLSTAGQFQ